MMKKMQKYLFVLLLFCCFFWGLPSAAMAYSLSDFNYYVIFPDDSETAYVFLDSSYNSYPIYIMSTPLESSDPDTIKYRAICFYDYSNYSPSYIQAYKLNLSTGKLSINSTFGYILDSDGNPNGVAYVLTPGIPKEFNGSYSAFRTSFSGSNLSLIQTTSSQFSSVSSQYNLLSPDKVLVSGYYPSLFGGGGTRGGGVGRREADEVANATQEKIDNVKNDMDSFGGGSASEGAGAGRDTIQETITNSQNKSEEIKENLTDSSTLASLITSIIDAILALPSLLANVIASLFDHLFDVLADFLSVLKLLLRSIVDAILAIPTLIIDAIGDMFDYLTDVVLESIINLLTGIPELIIQGLSSIFVPDTAVIQKEFDGMITDLNGVIGIDRYNMDNLFSSEAAPDNIDATYTIGALTYTGSFVDFSFLTNGVEYFRPFIRGFIVLLLFLFNIRQALAMFGLSSGEIKGAADGKGD